MKKFYLLIMALVAMATVNAQSSGVCPNGDPIFIKNIQYVSLSGTTYCVLYIDNTWPSADFTVIGKNNMGVDVIIPSTVPGASDHTKPDSSGMWQYDCMAYTATKIQVSKFGVGICETAIPPAAPLPIKMTAFTGRLETESTVKLDFTSEIELNSFAYEIERSADGKTFTKVGTINAAGNSASVIKYSYTDQLPSAGAYFYRIRMVDIDRTAEYSKVVYVNSKKGAGIVTKLFPNPFNSEVQLIGATSADLNTPGAIKVFNMSGQLINFKVVGANAIAIDPSAAKGVYFLKFRNNSSEQTFKLVKN